MTDSDANKFTFVSPFSLENCKRRLEGRHEKSTPLAWRGRTRLDVEVWDIEYRRAGFRLRSVPKSSMELSIWTPVKLVGDLHEQSGGQTIVAAEMQINYGFIYLPLFIFWGVATLWIFAEAQTLSLPLMILATGGLLILLMAWSFWWIDNQRRQLKAIVRESLGDPEFYPSLAG